MSEKGKVSRREFVKVGAGVVVGAAVAGAAGYYGGLGAAPKGPATTVTQTQTAAGATTAQNPLAGKTITIGAVEPLTGTFATFGKSAANGLNLAVSEINNSGGILGAKINLMLQDFGADPSVAVAATEKLITTNGANVIMGPFSSGAALSMGAVTEKYKIPFVTVGAGSDAPFQQGWQWIFGITPRTSTFAAIVLEYCREIIKPTSVALINDNSLMGQSSAASEVLTAKQFAWTLAANEFYAAGGVDYTSMLLKIKSSDPDLVVFSSYVTDLVLMMKQCKQIDLNPKGFISTGGAGAQTQDFITLAGPAAEYLIGGCEFSADKKWPDAQAVANLNAKLKAQFGREVDFQSACGYTEMYILKAAIESKGSFEPDAIRKGILALDWVIPWWGWNKYGPPASAVGPPIPPATTGAAYSPGLNWAPNTSLGSMQPVSITQVQGGKYVTVWPPEYASGPVWYPTPLWSSRPAVTTTT